MSRTIKFRAWIGKNIGFKAPPMLDEVYIDSEGYTYIKVAGVECDRLDLVEVQLNQFTGFTDKNGREIYEDDILSGHCKEQGKEDADGYNIRDLVRRRNGGFTCFGSKNMQSGHTRNENELYEFMWVDAAHFNTRAYYWQINNIEVIGNRYENPELLQQ